MKYILAFLFLFCTLTTKAQKPDVLIIDSLPPQGILLNQGWKWHAGDDPDFAKPNFDDSQWEDIDPTGRHTLAFTPIGEYLLLNLDSSISNTLAIRYYFQKGIRYKVAFDANYPLFSSKLYSIDSLATNLDYPKYFWEGFNIAMGVIFFLTHFVLFLFYPPTRANLWYSLWGFLGALGGYCLLAEKIHGELYLKNQFTLLAILAAPIGNFLLFYTVYLLLKQTRKFFLWIFITLSALATVQYCLSEHGGESLLSFLATLSYVLLVTYMGYDAYKQANKGGVYVMIGMFVYLISWVIFIFYFAGNPHNEAIEHIIFHVATLSLPVTVSTLLGLDFGNTNRVMIKNLQDINRLSEEKQQILSSQNETLERQVEQRTAELRASQSQLIQSEKLASLGELTAGIAHEIQNPLNFVNNFAEVSAEMLDEMHEELEKGDTTEAIAIATDLKTNLEKINHHGQRASSIVKGMLEHSRASTGVKEPTNLNALADEYLRLAYHGLRAKDNNFNATLETHFDPDLPLVSVIPQDIGRVLLNLINNAFYAVSERQKLMANGTSGTPLSESFRLSESYTPTITLRTKRLENAIEISVQDNGNGIPDTIRDKIFQPFFTTKPTGQGTGLGLSLAYDIVTKGHGGTLEVSSSLGEGTEFVVRLV